ncbi:O-linked N-acetylglucosamine transferase, SPINDLY family protein [Cronbergia sp. UHCC 0137]|uniref:O-linked N-acetylglucosamine transferase, SPINDLY family protein n=1 Tax=Cronbergia sp. UHCC 0137 TaxID=3110239 RepID=UPI002B2024E6|nr:O-linked N-acetylglucosamine transferase, SPINDLY family protein [Cronbergia sp. UHCC 0137]MEA5616956.1 O-linked N-acetylglucosamine transferase, SPINDLY family protein [Cronbergia sp. UHCC 0137]
MTNIELEPDITSLEQRARQYWFKNEYSLAANCYEQAITAQPEVKSHYWNLGLMLLLQEQEAEAQLTWMLGMEAGEPQQIEAWTIELIQILHQEAKRRESLLENTIALAIRQHIREINPLDFTNLLHLIQLAIKLETFNGDELIDLGIIELLQTTEILDIDLLWPTLKTVLNYNPFHPSVFQFAEACLNHVQKPKTFINPVVLATIKITYSMRQPKVAIPLIELCLRLEPENVEVLNHLALFYLFDYNYVKGIEVARLGVNLADKLADKTFSTYILQKGLMDAAIYWQETCEAVAQQKSLIESLIAENKTDLEVARVLRLYQANYFAAYIEDHPQKNRLIHNQIANFCQSNIQNYASEKINRYSQRTNNKKDKLTKIGYVSHCFCNHSVGFLARWLFQHHNRDKYQIHAYLINYKQINDPLQQWYINNATQAYLGGMHSDDIAEKIYEDEIDILIDLDSITLDVACEIMALKPAPVQATWLGWDASGIPTVDYFIADSYVLPDSAQDYYAEKIWRLPQTYIAVDGFEVGVPTLRRDKLDIPSDAVVYLSGQRGYKRHPETARLQMKIIKEVPNSYFLIKGFGDSETVQQFFRQLAEQEGVNADKMRFLPLDFSEAVHRANLAIADIVLDTYPYNGATTTLETLWMGIPIVTRVGQQFAARNSYTMMMNVGVTEGIAWSDEEYVEWGVRLGKDAVLRQQVAWKLRQSRQTAPLWNGKQFARDMEQAYEQMWERYLLL